MPRKLSNGLRIMGIAALSSAAVSAIAPGAALASSSTAVSAAPDVTYTATSIGLPQPCSLRRG